MRDRERSVLFSRGRERRKVTLQTCLEGVEVTAHVDHFPCCYTGRNSHACVSLHCPHVPHFFLVTSINNKVTAYKNSVSHCLEARISHRYTLSGTAAIHHLQLQR